MKHSRNANASRARAAPAAIAVILSFVVILPAAAQEYGSGLDAYRQGDYAAALREWRPLARQGHADAQYRLATMYEYAQGVGQNDGEAAAWYRKAALQGVAAAQYRLGVLYDNNWGVPGNDGEAAAWYAQAAAQGHALAQHDLALMYASGTGVAKDDVRAHMWLSVAVALGNEFMIEHRNRIAAGMTSAQVARARRLARDWMAQYRKR